MSQPVFLTIAEQVAEYLRDEISLGKLTDTIPGSIKLSKELGVNSKTIENALQLLIKDGVLVGQGAGRPRRIVSTKVHSKPSLRVTILLYEEDTRKLDFILNLQHKLTKAGHIAVFASKTLVDLKKDEHRVAHFVKRNESDAWIVIAGSRGILEWFSRQQIAVFALSGRRSGLPIASVGPDKRLACSLAVKRLAALKHHRIILLVRTELRAPRLALFGQIFLKEMKAQGILTSNYNIPHWEESVGGLHACLDSLFQTTPPTALIVDAPTLFFATQQFLLKRGIRVPQDISIICTDGSPYFSWCKPSIAHFRWANRPLIQRILRWAANVTRGKEDQRQTTIKTEFIDGDTIGPAPKKHNT